MWDLILYVYVYSATSKPCTCTSHSSSFFWTIWYIVGIFLRLDGVKRYTCIASSLHISRRITLYEALSAQKLCTHYELTYRHLLMYIMLEEILYLINICIPFKMLWNIHNVFSTEIPKQALVIILQCWGYLVGIETKLILQMKNACSCQYYQACWHVQP